MMIGEAVPLSALQRDLVAYVWQVVVDYQV